MNQSEVQALIIEECDRVKAMLLEKNKSYGNSAFEPVGIFAKGDPAEQIAVRIDDKLSRIQAGKNFENEDTVLDLIGYLVLMRVWRAIEASREVIIEEIETPDEIINNYPEKFKN